MIGGRTVGEYLTLNCHLVAKRKTCSVAEAAETASSYRMSCLYVFYVKHRGWRVREVVR